MEYFVVCSVLACYVRVLVYCLVFVILLVWYGLYEY